MVLFLRKLRIGDGAFALLLRNANGLGENAAERLVLLVSTGFGGSGKCFTRSGICAGAGRRVCASASAKNNQYRDDGNEQRGPGKGAAQGSAFRCMRRIEMVGKHGISFVAHFHVKCRERSRCLSNEEFRCSPTSIRKSQSIADRLCCQIENLVRAGEESDKMR